MRNAHVRYMCYPSVVEVGKKTTVYIRPRDISRVFLQEHGYTLGVFGVFEDSDDYHKQQPLDHGFEIKDGCLVFEHCFDREQEYSIRFSKAGETPVKISLYAVEPDLYALRPLKGDLHSHSYYSDGADGVAMTPADYREEGFDFFALTDHNRMYTSECAAELYDGVPLGLTVLRGEEIHTPGSLVHIVNVGGRDSVCNKYITDPEGYEKALDGLEKDLMHIDEQYRRRVAMAKWACDNVRKGGGVAILAHPFWRPNINNVSADFLEYLYDPDIFDAFEIVGGINSMYNNMQLALWHKKCMEGKALSVVASSDSHDHDSEKGTFGRRFTVVFAKKNTSSAIVEAIKTAFALQVRCPHTAKRCVFTVICGL